METTEQQGLRKTLDQTVVEAENRMNYYLECYNEIDNTEIFFHKAIEASIDLDIERATRIIFLELAGLTLY